MPTLTRLAILDDYQGVTLSLGPWDQLQGIQIDVFRDTITDLDALAQRLAPRLSGGAAKYHARSCHG